MKTKQLLAVAMCSALAFVSCEKAIENSPVLGDGEPIDLVLKLGGAADTRMVQADPSDEDLTPDIVSGYVYFYSSSSGNIWEHRTLDPAQANDITGQEFQGVDSKSTDVYVVANYPQYYASPLASVTTIAMLESTLMDIQTQNRDNLAMTSVCLSTVYDVDHDGEIKLVNDEYEARVLLQPVLSRLQFSDIKSDDENIISYNLAGVYLDNFYKEFLPTASKDVTSDLVTVGTDGSKLGVQYLSMCDVAATPVGSDNKKKVSAGDFSASNEVFAYHLKPKNSGDYVPSLIIKLTDIKCKDAKGNITTIDVGYLTLKHYMKGSTEITKFEPGNLYSIDAGDFVFDLNDITDNPNMSDIDLTVYVSVLPWVVNAVTPLL